ncbi:MAG: hypothetical protein IAF02_27970 [Anaerolineae bacterium]|nr:hypothetical protein [Anaerolineae bacterium]
MNTIIPKSPQISTTTDTTAERPTFRVRVEHVQAFLKEHMDLFGSDPKPLAIGIHHAILACHPELDLSGLKRALTLRCAWFQYLKALTQPGAVRYDLDGQPAGEVTAEQVEIARTRLAEWKAAKKAKAKAKKPPKPPAPAVPVPPPPTPPSPPLVPPGRPVLRLKKPANPVVAASTVTRKDGAK